MEQVRTAVWDALYRERGVWAGEVKLIPIEPDTFNDNHTVTEDADSDPLSKFHELISDMMSWSESNQLREDSADSGLSFGSKTSEVWRWRPDKTTSHNCQ